MICRHWVGTDSPESIISQLGISLQQNNLKYAIIPEIDEDNKHVIVIYGVNKPARDFLDWYVKDRQDVWKPQRGWRKKAVWYCSETDPPHATCNHRKKKKHIMSRNKNGRKGHA